MAGNLLGDGGGREVMLGLQMRKEMGLPDMKMTVSSSISPEIFSSITKLSSGTKKKGKKKGKKVIMSLYHYPVCAHVCSVCLSVDK